MKEEELLVMNENKVNESENLSSWINIVLWFCLKTSKLASSNNLLGMVCFVILKSSFCTSNTSQLEDI